MNVKSDTMKKNNYPDFALGTWSWGTGMFGGDHVFGNNIAEEQLKEVFDIAMSKGFNLWDTAFVYAMGGSEKLVGKFATEYDREKLFLSTKFTPQLARMFGNSVEKMCDNSLKLLKTDYIDIYWIHNPADVKRWTPGLIPLLKSGKVKSVGVSNHNIEEIKLANDILGEEGFKISAVQNHYSLLYRSSEKGGVLDYCKENDIQFWAYMVLEQGALSGKYDTSHPLPENSDRGKMYNPILPQLEKLISLLKEIGESHGGYNVSQVAEAWAIKKGTVPIIGVTKPLYIDDAIGAASLVLSDEEMALIEQTAEEANVNTKGGWEHSME